MFHGRDWRCGGATALLYFFSNRRWRNPDDAKDLEQLRAAWQQLSDSSVIFAGQCKFERLCKIIKTFACEWEDVEALAKANRKTQRSAASSEPDAPRAQKRRRSDASIADTMPSPLLSPKQRSPGPDQCSARSGDQALPGIAALASATALVPPHGAFVNQLSGPAPALDTQLVLALLNLANLSQPQHQHPQQREHPQEPQQQQQQGQLRQGQPSQQLLQQMLLSQLVQQGLATPAGVPSDNMPSAAVGQPGNLAVSPGPRPTPIHTAGGSAQAPMSDPLVAMFVKQP